MHVYLSGFYHHSIQSHSPRLGAMGTASGPFASRSAGLTTPSDVHYASRSPLGIDYRHVNGDSDADGSNRSGGNLWNIFGSDPNAVDSLDAAHEGSFSRNTTDYSRLRSDSSSNIDRCDIQIRNEFKHC